MVGIETAGGVGALCWGVWTAVQQVLPPVGWVARKVAERHFAIKATIKSVNWMPTNYGLSLYSLAEIELVNHSAPKLRIIDGQFVIRKRWLRLFFKDMYNLPAALRVLTDMGHPTVKAAGAPTKDVYLEAPESVLLELEALHDEDSQWDRLKPKSELPGRMGLFVRLRTAGKLRQIQRKVHSIENDKNRSL